MRAALPRTIPILVPRRLCCSHPSHSTSIFRPPACQPCSDPLIPPISPGNKAVHTLSEAGISLTKRWPMNGSLDNKSLRTLGTSPKKKMAKMPAVAPKAPRVIPLVCLLVFVLLKVVVSTVLQDRHLVLVEHWKLGARPAEEA